MGTITRDSMTDYEKAKQSLKSLPKYYLGQEVMTKQGKGIIVELRMEWNGLYVVPERSEAIIWYSTNEATRRPEGGNWVSYTYKLTELSMIL